MRNEQLFSTSAELAAALISQSPDTCSAVQALADTLAKLAAEDFGECPVQTEIARRLSALARDMWEAELETM